MPYKSLHSSSHEPPQICGHRFKEKRESLGWSIEELVKKTTFSKNQVSQIENGLSTAFYSEQVKFKSALKIAEILNLSSDIAFEFTNTNHMTNIHPPQHIDPISPGWREYPRDVTVNDSMLANNISNQEFEKTKARIKLQLKILIFCFLFLTLLFITQKHDLFSNLPSFFNQLNETK
jgi:transcriptional regulator with XRE-family HTH domain